MSEEIQKDRAISGVAGCIIPTIFRESPLCVGGCSGLVENGDGNGWRKGGNDTGNSGEHTYRAFSPYRMSKNILSEDG